MFCLYDMTDECRHNVRHLGLSNIKILFTVPLIFFYRQLHSTWEKVLICSSLNTLLCEKHNLSVEVETKHGWGDGKFQWGDMHIPRRKFRYTKVDGEVFFVVFNTNRTQAGIMTKDSVKKERVVNKFNRLSRLHEDYISVPVEEIIWV